MKKLDKLFQQQQLLRQRYNPLNDYLFYKIMGEKGDEVQLLGFINAVLGKTGDDRFTSVEIIENKSFTPKVIGDKASILDVRAVLQSKTKVNIEVQVRNQYNMDRRSLFYWSKEYAESLEEGQDYRELPNVIAINIVNFNFPPVRNFHTRFHLREDSDRDMVLTDALEIHFINMVQYRKQARKGVVNDPLSRWMAWLNAKSPPELLAEVVKMDSAIQMADERMVYVTGDKEAIRAYERRQMALSDYNSSINYARGEGLKKGMRKGIREGKKEGMAKTSLEIARKMKNAGRPLSEIQEFTGLSIEAIEQITK
jgi:predicted transposase/invertase (TIGR01784 family)